MQVSIRTKANGSMELMLDQEAARAVLASIRFTSRFHEEIASLARATEQELQTGQGPERTRRDKLCR